MKETVTTKSIDFLNRIVNEGRGVESPIAPRLRSLFEPMSTAAVPPAAEMEELESPIAVPEFKDAWRAPMAQPGPVALDLRPLTLHQVEFAGQRNELAPRKNDHLAGEVEATPAASLRPAPVWPHTANIHAPRQSEPAPLEPRESGIESSPDRLAHASVREVDRPFAVQPALLPSARAVMRHGETDEIQPEEGKRESPKARLKELHEESGALLPEPAAIRVPLAALPEAPRANRSTSRDLQPAKVVQEQPAPVINVTIGRVEVRAVQGAAKSRAEHTKPKALSLDDYLKQRGGRR
jgi:hypothetical protein